MQIMDLLWVKINRSSSDFLLVVILGLAGLHHLIH